MSPPRSIVVGALDALGRDDAGVRAELVEAGVEAAGGSASPASLPLT